MSRRKKRKNRGNDGEPSAPSVPERISRPFAEALRSLDLAKEKKAEKKREGRGAFRKEAVTLPPPGPAAPAPNTLPPPGPARPEPATDPANYSYEDRVAFQQAFKNVRPLGARRSPGQHAAPTAPTAVRAGSRRDQAEEDQRARDRLAALVAGGIRFEVRREEGGFVEGKRAEDGPDGLRRLKRGRAIAEGQIDLHGLTADEAERDVVRFIREAQRGGRRTVRIVHGKGLHSPSGLGVLGDRVLEALTDGGAAPFVRAFVTAAPEQGGTGALLVLLTR